MLSQAIKNRHFLIVDDFESVRNMLIDDLGNLGVTNISQASSGQEAFNLIQATLHTNPVKFILCDIIMSNGNGIDLVEDLRKKLKLTKIPIVMISSKADINYVLDAVNAGANAYLIKPWTLDDLEKKIMDADQKCR